MLENLPLCRQARSKSTTMSARRNNDNNADMDYHAVHPPDYKAGGDSKREEKCQQYPQTFNITATGASSSTGRQEATGAASSPWRQETVKDPLGTGQGKVF